MQLTIPTKTHPTRTHELQSALAPPLIHERPDPSNDRPAPHERDQHVERHHQRQQPRLAHSQPRDTGDHQHHDPPPMSPMRPDPIEHRIHLVKHRAIVTVGSAARGQIRHSLTKMPYLTGADTVPADRHMAAGTARSRGAAGAPLATDR